MPDRPDVARETPLADLLASLTPNDRFFVRSHAHETPRIDRTAYVLEVANDGDGAVRSFSLADLRALPRASAVVTLACSGNGRSGFDPAPGGLPWGFGAIATARWDGVRLRDVVAACGPISPDVLHVAFDAFDAAPDERRPPFRRSLPRARALDDGTLVVDTMNGEPIPAEHGGPVRLIVGGWTGNHAVKWLRRVTLAREPDHGHWMVNDYRIPGVDGTMRMIESSAPIAIVASPAAGAHIASPFEIEGVAYGEPAPARVRVEVDGAPAGDVPVRYADGPYAWGRWSLRLALSSGPHRIEASAVDAAGAMYEHTPWNAGGYLFNGAHAITVAIVSKG